MKRLTKGAMAGCYFEIGIRRARGYSQQANERPLTREELRAHLVEIIGEIDEAIADAAKPAPPQTTAENAGGGK